MSAAVYEFRVPESRELGSVVGVIRATDKDIGENAEMDYRIIGSDGPVMFDISTNRSTQEGVIVLRKVRRFLLVPLLDRDAKLRELSMRNSRKFARINLQKQTNKQQS